MSIYTLSILFIIYIIGSIIYVKLMRIKINEIRFYMKHTVNNTPYREAESLRSFIYRWAKMLGEI